MGYESVAITPGSGVNVATDTVASQAIQVFKEDIGSDGNSVPRRVSTPQNAGTQVAVDVTSTAVLAANPSRRAVILVNDSDTKIYVRFGTGATTSNGVPLYPGGGSFEFDYYDGVIHAIHGAAGTKTLCVIEV